MKKYLIASSVLATAFISTGAMAQAYVSVDAGAGHTGMGCVAFADCNKNYGSYKITGGYKFGSGFAGELGYIDFGSAFGYDSRIPDVDAKFNVKAWTLGAAYELPIAADLSCIARIGIASMTTTVSPTVVFPGFTTSHSVTTAKTEAYYGLGANYAITQHMKIETGVDWSHAALQGSTGVVRSISAGLRYEF